jgi:hypothetical protein
MESQEGNSARRQQANTLILTVVRVVRLHLATAHLAALGHARQTTPVPLPPPTAPLRRPPQVIDISLIGDIRMCPLTWRSLSDLETINDSHGGLNSLQTARFVSLPSRFHDTLRRVWDLTKQSDVPCTSESTLQSWKLNK